MRMHKSNNGLKFTILLNTIVKELLLSTTLKWQGISWAITGVQGMSMEINFYQKLVQLSRIISHHNCCLDCLFFVVYLFLEMDIFQIEYASFFLFLIDIVQLPPYCYLKFYDLKRH